MRVHDAQTGGHGWADLTELQGVTIDFWGGPQLHLCAMASGGPAPLARKPDVYRVQLRSWAAGRGLYATYDSRLD